MTGQQVMARIRERDDGEILGRVKLIARAHDVTLDEMLGRCRTPSAAAARDALWAVLHDSGHWSYSRLGFLFGRDHTSVSAGIKRHRTRYAELDVREQVVA